MSESLQRKVIFMLVGTAVVLGLFSIFTAAHAATILVTPTNSLANGIASAATGDTVLVQASTRNESIVLNKAITVKADGLVTLRPGNYRGIDIKCSNCTVDGFTLENFSQAAATNSGTPRTNVKLLNLNFLNAGAGIWVEGTGWTVERVTLHFRARDGEDYLNAFGSGHTIRRCYFYGLQIPGDLGSGPDYKHSDAIQSWTSNGKYLRDTMIEECIFVDFKNGCVWLNNETGTASGHRNIVIRNNVFWGNPLPNEPGTNLIGIPSWGTNVSGPNAGAVIIKNNIYHYLANGVSLRNTRGLVSGNIIEKTGTAYASEGTAVFNRGILGNVLWDNDWDGGVSGAPDKLVNPQFQNAAAVGAEVVGPDGVPWTADDAWLLTNATLAAYGPQLTTFRRKP